MTTQANVDTGAGQAEEAVRVLDPAKFSSLKSLIGNDKAAIALEKFRQELDSHVAAISAEATPIDEKGMYAHKLVGTAGSIGLDELSAKSRSFEQAVKRDAGDVDWFLDQLIAAAKRAQDALRSL